MFPNQISNQRNQQNDSNKPPNMGNIGNMGNMQYYPYYIGQQFQNQMPPSIPPNQVQQRSKKEPRKRASIVQVQSTSLNQPLQNQTIQNQIYPPQPPTPQIASQVQDLNGNMDYSMKLMNISDDKIDFFCQLFDIPMQRTRQGIINFFMTTTLSRLCQNSFKLMNDFFDFLTNPQDLLMQLREPKIPRIFNPSIGTKSRYILLQFYQGVPFEFSHSVILPQNGILCVGQFVSDYLNNAPFGSVKINDREIMSVNFGEIGQYFLFGPPENISHVSIQLSSTLIEHHYVWFVIHYLMPNYLFASDYIRERLSNGETDDQNLVRTTVCNGCPPFSFQSAIESAFHTGFIICPSCNQKVKFDQIRIEYQTNPNSVLSGSSTNPSTPTMNGYSGLMIGPPSTQISRFGSANSIGKIPITSPQLSNSQQIQPQPSSLQSSQLTPPSSQPVQQQKKNRQKKMAQKVGSQQPQQQMAMQMPIGINGMPVLKNIHGMNNMMPMKNMNMSGLMGLNVGIRNPVPINSPMSMNKSLLSPPSTNSSALPMVQTTMNQMLNGMNQQQPQQAMNLQQGQIQLNQSVSVTTPSQPPSQPSSQTSSQSSQTQQKQAKQKQTRKQKSQIQSDENDQQKTLTKQPKQSKQKQKSAKALSQPPAQMESVESSNQSQQPRHSSTPQFLDKMEKQQEKPEEEEEVIVPDTPEMKKAKLAMSGFLCMNLRCTRNEINWKHCVYENDSELHINDNDFHLDEYQDVDDYLDFIDSFKQ